MSDASVRIDVADGLALHARLWGGRSPQFLLVHGFSHGGFVWRALAAAMPEYSMAALDLRGHGDSSHDPQRRYSIHDHVDDLVAAARALDLRDYVLVGHSLGASVAALAAQRLPRPPRALVLVDGGPGLSPQASAHIREEFLRLKFRYRSPDEYLQRLSTSMPLASASLLEAMAVDSLQPLRADEYRLKSDRALGYQVHAPSIEDELWQALGRQPAPLLLIRGAVSALCNKRWCDEFAARVPQATIETVARAGHAVMLDNPARFGELLRQYAAQWLAARPVPTLHADPVS
ncbi:alpha/beta fold hydrolase [Lysobacter enzymogenes]|uniref:Alpha/beta fold family hydrolase n=1 Tax=Lysobacter enzymogenes TaxID=69 RepID=A0AAU9ARW0_LYSEN|nr:alpha/beta hydrolase [Lysobacter enzymogenes]BAV98000.1 alpha/beta fold family hydrolase [Lysobacter enzymogenes]